MNESGVLEELHAGQQIPFGGDRWVAVPEVLASAFSLGDRLVVVQETGDLLHIPSSVHTRVSEVVGAAYRAFGALATVTDAAITEFFAEFARRLENDEQFAPIAAANAEDVEAAHRRGRSTTRLELSDTMRSEMIAGLRVWRDASSPRDEPLRTLDHDGWTLEARRSPLGIVGFVFEGRPNVFADAVGVLRTGNAVVFRIGSDALGTARAIVSHALQPALDAAGLPPGTVGLVDLPERSAGWALFSDRRLSLAVARGSGPAVAQLGAVARQSGIAVSLHGTGGAWMVVGATADPARLAAAVRASLDRKVCNTLNVVCVTSSVASELVPVVLEALDAAGEQRGAAARVHITATAAAYVPAERFEREVTVVRADGEHRESMATLVDLEVLATEWEWEQTPEISLTVVDDVAAAVELCNTYSPRFIASLISEDRSEHQKFYGVVDAPFVSDGFTRWVDGLYALQTPELGLSNWESGRLLGRSAVLSGDSVHTVRLRARIADPDLHR